MELDVIKDELNQRNINSKELLEKAVEKGKYLESVI
jgi:hypothetical protein